METLTLTTPALLFSAVSLILLAYTNRFLGYAQLIRSLYEKYKQNKDLVLNAQIKNLRQRLYLTRAMQLLGVLSLFLCVASMFFIYIGWNLLATWIFGSGLVALIVSLALSAWEIQISVKAMELHLRDMESIERNERIERRTNDRNRREPNRGKEALQIQRKPIENESVKSLKPRIQQHPRKTPRDHSSDVKS